MGVSEDIIFETFRDVTLRAELYFKKNGQVGITEEDVIWFRHIMNVEIFKIGSLQFQPFQMLYLENEELYTIYSADAEKLVPSGCPVLNCHVQRGVDLSGQSVENSFVKAKAFFKRGQTGNYIPGGSLLQLASVSTDGAKPFGYIQYPSVCGAVSDHRNL